jgi:PPOX class probable F420-dependent enzyme
METMTDPGDAARELLALRLIATLGTLNADGSAQLTPIWYLFDPDNGRLYIATGSRSRKVRNVQARPQATLLVDRRQPEGHCWVSALGAATVLGGEAAQAINARIRQRYLSPAGEAAYGTRLIPMDDVTIVLTPSSWRSWALSNLEDIASEKGLPPESIPGWFLPLD